MSEGGSETRSVQKSREMSLFPSSLDNRKSSTLFMKRMLFIIVSDIMKKRRLLPPSTFKDLLLDGLKCCTVTEDTYMGCKLSTLLYAIAEAIEKNYLRDLFILISAEETDNMDEVIEAYTLTFQYADGGGLLVRSSSQQIALSCKSVVELRERVYALFDRLNIITNMLSPLPEGAFPYFKLTYYTGTPLAYEPVGFKSSPTTYRFKETTFSSKTSIGTFSTKFESCVVHMESIFFESALEEQEQIGSGEMEVDQDEERPTKERKEIPDETPKCRPKKDRKPKQTKRAKEPSEKKKKKKKRVVVEEEAEEDDQQAAPQRISSTDHRKETPPGANEVVESMRASPSEETSPNEPDEANKNILHHVEGVASATDLQTSEMSYQYPGDNEETPESTAQFATFGSTTGPYIDSPRMDSTVSLPTIAELVVRGPAPEKPAKSPSPGISISKELDIARELFVQRSPEPQPSTSAGPKAKKMKISRSIAEYYKE